MFYGCILQPSYALGCRCKKCCAMPLSEYPSKALAANMAIHKAVHVSARDAVRTCRHAALSTAACDQD